MAKKWPKVKRRAWEIRNDRDVFWGQVQMMQLLRIGRRVDEMGERRRWVSGSAWKGREEVKRGADNFGKVERLEDGIEGEKWWVGKAGAERAGLWLGCAHPATPMS